jgi:peptidoglycan/LPS O-acetylase OafA/YrhL
MPSSSYEEFRCRRAFGSLDGIRCFSIVAVVWHHTVAGVSWLPATKRGFLGVDMFFVLSGFLIVTLLLRERDRSGGISLMGFYARRALRIFPLYYGLIVALTAVFFFGRGSRTAEQFFRELPYYGTYTANWVELHGLLAVSWSLAAEEQFYLVWPPVERFAASAATTVLVAIVLVNQLINFRLLDGELLAVAGLRAAELPMLQATFTPICLGVFLAHVLHSERGFGVASRALSSRWGAPLALVAIVALCNAPRDDISGPLRLLVQIAMTSLLCACVIREDHWLQRTLTFAPVARIGVISYGLYLLHPIVRHAAGFVVSRTLPDLPLGLFLSCLFGTALVADLSYRFYEAPFLRMKEGSRWAARPASPARP